MWERLTKKQEDKIAKGKCSDCDGQLLEGPRGGLAINVNCSVCGATFWVGWPFPPMRLNDPKLPLHHN